MKPSVIIAAAFFITIAAVGTHAQESGLPLDVEAASRAAAADAQRAPMLVIRETPLQKAQPADAKSAGTATKAGKPMFVAGASELTYEPGEMTSGNPNFDRMVMESAAANDVDPGLIFAVMRQESGCNPRARSYKGACGLMQLMPGTARRFGVVNIFDPAQNIEGGARYLRFLLDKFKDDVQLSLAGYNAGEGAVVDAGYRVPRYRETQAYVRNISAKYGSTKHKSASVEVSPKAPGAMVVSSGASSRLSNNY